MKVIAFNGSARKGGNTSQIVQVALQELEKAGVQTELVELAGAHPTVASPAASAGLIKTAAVPSPPMR